MYHNSYDIKKKQILILYDYLIFLSCIYVILISYMCKGNSRSIVDNVKFNNEPLEEFKINQKKRKRQEKAENKQLAEEEYNQQIQEQQYKRLMHLLSKSKFYASFIVSKIDKSLEKNASKPNKSTKKNGKKIEYANENIAPHDKGKKRNNNTQKYISKDVNKYSNTYNYDTYNFYTHYFMIC